MIIQVEGRDQCAGRFGCPNYKTHRNNRRHLYWRPWQHRHGLSISKMHDEREGASRRSAGELKGDITISTFCLLVFFSYN